MKYQERFKRPNRKKLYKKLGLRTVQLLSSLGAFGFILATCYSFFVGDVRLVFEKPHGRSYIFSIINDSPADMVIEKFQVSYPSQPVIAKTTKAIYAESREGELTLPGGNISRVPIIEFRELDGETISARDTHKFRLPPTNSRDYLQLEAAIFEISYEVTPKNKLLRLIDGSLKIIALRNTEEVIRYIVIDNYWVPTRSKSSYEAIRIACRDNDMLSKGNLCSQ
ncbi:hypothetical protein [Pseudomonas rhodesiae]|jgi:hypothetical protein|uniref:hypothetical protein n=1 Tax=Pseudomonas rhodesiae TaxID=76760 RepID=UPI00264782D8|nr:hypothetical protein [Pseudomonas rhodesiae]MDN6864810.1 hypothetical protein [Pseudomonas rhodesiae]